MHRNSVAVSAFAAVGLRHSLCFADSFRMGKTCVLERGSTRNAAQKLGVAVKKSCIAKDQAKLFADPSYRRKKTLWWRTIRKANLQHTAAAALGKSVDEISKLFGD